MRSAPVRRPASQARILIVDDNCDGNLARRSVLEESGYQVVAASSGPDALTLAQDSTIDLVVTDFKMAPMNGLELIAQLRARNFRNPIILLTGFANSVGLSPETTGADAVIQKSANEIVALLRYTRQLLIPRKPAISHPAARRASAQSKQ